MSGDVDWQRLHEFVEGAIASDHLGDFLQSLKRYPLLTKDQEVFHGQQVQQAQRLFECREESFCDTDDKWAQLAGISLCELQKVLQSGKRSRDRLILCNLRLVVNIAKGFSRQGIETLDLINEGILGLARAVQGFDPKRGYRFSTYAYWFISKAVRSAAEKKSRIVRLTATMLARVATVRTTRSTLAQQLKRPPTLTELAATLAEPKLTRRSLRLGRSLTEQEQQAIINRTKHEIMLLEERSQAVYSLDLQASFDATDDGLPLMDSIPNTNQTPEEYIVNRDRCELARALLAQLPDLQQQIMVLRYGFDQSGEERSLCAIEAVLKNQGHQLSKSRIKTLLADASAYLRQLAEG